MYICIAHFLAAQLFFKYKWTELQNFGGVVLIH